jgi:hypothetical protein
MAQRLEELKQQYKDLAASLLEWYTAKTNAWKTVPDSGASLKSRMIYAKN